MTKSITNIDTHLTSTCQINLHHAILDPQRILFQLATGRAQAFASTAIEHPVVELAVTMRPLKVLHSGTS